MARHSFFIGTAGWSIPREHSDLFPGGGSHLERYSRVLPCAEINSSFYRPISFDLYAKWAKQVSADFRFAVKLPREITHDERLRRARKPLVQFLSEVRGLGRKLGPLLVQLPPSLEFEARVATTYFALMRDLHEGAVVCEPRHTSWFETAADELLSNHHVGRVAADPAKVEAARIPGGWVGTAKRKGIAYWRLHGSPRMYYSPYSADEIALLVEQMRSRAKTSEVWCIFDNTASGAAAGNAVALTHAINVRRTNR